MMGRAYGTHPQQGEVHLFTLVSLSLISILLSKHGFLNGHFTSGFPIIVIYRIFNSIVHATCPN